MQLFKNHIPKEMLYDLLCNNTLKTEDYYCINKESYKKLVFNNKIVPFVQSLKEYYHTSKQSYLESPSTYSKFITIVRHICKLNNIKYTSKIKYDKSAYNINYYIYYNSS